MDWGEVGEFVRQRGRQRLLDCVHREINRWPTSNAAQVFQDSPNAYAMLDVPFDDIAKLYEHENDGTCFDYAILNLFTSPKDLASFIAVDRQSGRNGRPIAETSRAAATMALFFDDAWCREIKQSGISCYGHRGEMKDIAASAVVNDFFAWRYDWGMRGVVEAPGSNVEAFTDIVRDLMDKPVKRRRPPNGTCLYFATKLPPKPPQKLRSSGVTG